MITTKIEKITPQCASEYLELNKKNNRKLNKNVVSQYASDMLSGRWDEENGASIKFDCNGELVDGQHRLAACIQAGVPFTTIVVYGVSRDAIITTDNGYSRSAGMVFQIYGIQNANCIAAIVKSHLGLKEKRNVIAGTGQGVWCGRMGNALVVEFYNKRKELYDEAFIIADRCYNSCRIMTVSQIGSIYAYLTDDVGYDGDYVADFFEQMTDYKPFEWNVLRECRKKFLEDKISTVHMEGSVKQA